MFSSRRLLAAACGFTLATFAPGASAADSAPIVDANEIAPGPFAPTDESLKQYAYPEWFRDAKFGIWAHWGPQAVPRQGDWYAKKMYISDQTDRRSGKSLGKPDADYNDHLKRYGHPSEFGYKDIIPLWKAERWDPQSLMALYRKVGAKYFVSMGTHHDNFFLWDSKIHRWNAVQMGPKMDVVGIWRAAALSEGLRFGISEHLGASFTWFQSAHGADKTGPKAGVPYDGNDPKYQDLYHEKAAADDRGWLTKNRKWQREWFDCIKEVVDLYHPDLLYSDSPLPFGDVGRSLVTHYYNQSTAENAGTTDVVYNCKEESGGRFVRDIERGVAEGISENPWQTDTSIGDWFYRTGQKYLTSGEVVRMLVDIVSKNGNLLLNVVQTPEGDLEPDVLKILDEIGIWTAANGEGIYDSRPWKVYGEGPSVTGAQEKGQFAGLRDVPKRPYTAEDFRFTTSKDGRTLYAFCLGKPTGELRIKSLGKDAGLADKAVANVEMLDGSNAPDWKQEADALVITNAAGAPDSPALGYRITFED